MSVPLRLLLLEDNAADAELNERCLRQSGWSFVSRRVECRDDFLEALEGFQPDAILADYSLPRFDGLQALALVRARAPNLPFIFVTGALGEEEAVELLCNGASDFILKHHLARLPMALERALEIARQRQALRQAEQALRESEERFRTLVETTLDWIWEIDTEGRYTYVSPVSRSLLGYAPEDLLGRTPFDLMPPAEAARVSAFFAEIAATPRPFAQLENTCLRQDGQPVVLESTATPIIGADGRLLGYRGIDRDISERKRQEVTLRLQAQRATALLELPRAADRLNESEFMQFGQDLAEELTGSQIAFVHFVNDDQETIELIAWSRRTLDGYCQATYDRHYPISQAGVWADALRQRAPVVFNDYATAPGKHGLPEGHAELIRLISVPVLDGERVCMMAGVGNKPTPYTDLDVETVQLIANEIWRIVRQRRAEQALSASEERLALALAGSELGTWDWQVQTGAIQLDDRWAQMLGYTLDELQPISIETWTRLCHPDDLPLAQALLERHFQSDIDAYDVETRLRHRDGHWVWVLDRGKVVEWDADGKPLRMAGTHLDITDRKEAEQQLRKLLLAVEQSPTSIVITDLEARIEYANPAFTQVSGYTLEEAREQNPRLLQSGQTPRAVYDDLWATLTRGEVWRGEFWNRRKDGSDYVELAVISPVRQADGRVTHYLAVKEDITARKADEEELEHYRQRLEDLVETRTAELRAAEEQSRLILESSADGLYGVDLEGRATFINPAACAMLGYAPLDFLGRHTHDLLHHTRADGTPYPREDCPVHGTLRDGRVLRQDEDIFWNVDGEPFPVSYSSHPMYRDGEIIGAVVSFFDISAKQQAEAARQAALGEAERLARLKSEFLANMSHEIRTPLNAVLGFAQIGVRESDGRRAHEFFKRILDSGQLLLGIVNDILDFSKIEAGKLHIEQGVIDLREIIERSINQLQTQALDKGLDFRLEESGDLPATCRGDPLRLAQVLTNLLSNAIKFTAQGEVVLKVSRDDQYLSWRVADTGIGMTDEQMDQLFRPFEQADGSITRRFGGTGLGLAITRRLVDMMGGEIQAESRLGAGTQFTVRIPLDEPVGALRSHPLRAEVPPSLRQQRLRGLIILVAEDNAANRLVLEELLNEEGCWLIQVENGQQAVERVTQSGSSAFDLVLMDIQMPVMDGFEATRQIHALVPTLPIIGLTAHALETERARCLEAGMVDHVAKPVDLDWLVATILRHAPISAEAGVSRSMVASGLSGAATSPLPDGRQTQIDWLALTERYRQRPAFLPKLLTSVIEVNTAYPSALRQAVKQGDLAQIAFLAHSIKGTAGNLFADHLRELSASTENNARAERPDAYRQAARLAGLLDILLREIADWQAAADAPKVMDADVPPPIDWCRLNDTLARLESLLALDDTAANTLFDESQSLLLQAFGEQTQRLGRHIQHFDYPAALDVLREARATLDLAASSG